MDFLKTLCESKLFPSQNSLDAKSKSQVADLAYRYLLILRILLLEDGTHKFARDYAKRAAEWGDFKKWHANANDLYVLLYGLEKIDHPTKGKGHFTINLDQIHRLLVAIAHDREYETLLRRVFMRLDSDLKIHNQSLSAMRRIVLNWEDQTTREKADTSEKLFKGLRHDAPRSELLKKLESVMDEYKEEREDEISESVGSEVYRATALKEFDLSKSIEWVARGTDDWRGVFRVGEQRFLVLIERIERSKPGTFLGCKGAAVDFALLSDRADPTGPIRDILPHIRDDNTGLAGNAARTVFSFVLSAALQYIRATKPVFIEIQGRENEKVPLYRAMAKFLRPMMQREGYGTMRVMGRYVDFWRTDMNVPDLVAENATAGATSAASVASSIGSAPKNGSLGVGFDPNGDQGIYAGKPKKQATKAKPILRR